MKPGRLPNLAIFALPCLPFAATSSLAQETAGKSIQAALAKVDSGCPQGYPEIVTPLPEPGSLPTKSTDELTRMLENWNPSLRADAAKELGTRGDEVIPALRKATRSDNWTIRAGAATALAAIVKHQVSNWKEFHPGVDDSRQGQEKIKKKHADLVDDFIRLTKDPQLEVRKSALGGLAALSPKTREATTAVLELCADDDEYLAQDAMITLEKQFGIDAVQERTVIAALNQAMNAPLPRGKGHVLRLIVRMDEQAQKQFIPELLEHLDWQPNRDTMFGAGGQVEALHILTALEVKEVIPRLPRLMTKTMRGPGLFLPCLDSAKSFGKDAKVIVPELRAMLPGLEEELAKARSKDAIQQKVTRLKETISHLESL
jgi:hypothetical protein